MGIWDWEVGIDTNFKAVINFGFINLKFYMHCKFQDFKTDETDFNHIAYFLVHSLAVASNFALSFL